MTYQPEPLADIRKKDLVPLRASYGILAEHYETVVDERDEAVKRLKDEREKTQKTIEDALATATKKADRMQAKIRDLQGAIEASDQKMASALGSGPELKEAESKIASLESRVAELAKILTYTQEESQAPQNNQQDTQEALKSETADSASGDKKDKVDSHPPGPPASEASTPKTTAPVPKGPYLAEPRILPPEFCFADQPESWGPSPRQWMTLEQQVEFAEELAKLEAAPSLSKVTGVTKSGGPEPMDFMRW